MRANRILPASLVALVAALTILLGAPSALAAGPATHLEFSQQPTDVAAGDHITPAVVVTVLDADASPVAGVDVTLALTGGAPGAALGGTPTQSSAADGTATFPDLTVDKVGTGYQLTASASGVSDLASDPFAVTAGALASIVVSPPDVTITAGGSQSYTAEGFDAQGNDRGDVTGDTTFTIQAGSGGDCTGATCTATVAGNWDVTGTYTGGAPTDSSTIHVTAAAAARLAFGDQPVSTRAGTPLPNVTVEVQDAFGNLVTEAQPGNKISLTIAHNPSGAHLSGGGPHSIVDGVALFHNLIIDKPGTALTLRATAEAGFTPILSQAFNSKGTTLVTMSVSSHIIALNQPVRLVAHLARCLDRCVLTLYRGPAGETPSQIGVADRPVNPQGNVVITVTPQTNTSYWAVFTGDSRYVRAVSNHSQVDVRVLVGAGLRGYYGTSKGGYRLYHYQPSCAGSLHTRCPEVEGWVTPDKTGKRLYFTLQAFSGGRWRTVTTTHYTMDAGSRKSIVWYYTGPSVKNVPLRTRAYFAGDAFNAGATSVWRYFKVV